MAGRAMGYSYSQDGGGVRILIRSSVQQRAVGDRSPDVSILSIALSMSMLSRSIPAPGILFHPNALLSSTKHRVTNKILRDKLALNPPPPVSGLQIPHAASANHHPSGSDPASDHPYTPIPTLCTVAIENRGTASEFAIASYTPCLRQVQSAMISG